MQGNLFDYHLYGWSWKPIKAKYVDPPYHCPECGALSDFNKKTNAMEVVGYKYVNKMKIRREQEAMAENFVVKRARQRGDDGKPRRVSPINIQQELKRKYGILTKR